MNGDFEDGLSGWTVLSDAGSVDTAFRIDECSNGVPPDQICFDDMTGLGVEGNTQGSNVLVSSLHTVLPGEALSVRVAVEAPYGFVVGDPDTMHYLSFPANPQRSQARLDVYDAGNPGFPTALSLQSSVFNPTDIEAAPYLGNLISGAGFTNLNDNTKNNQKFYTDPTTITSSLAPYVGKTVYFAYRTSNNSPLFYYQIFLEDFVIVC